MSAIRALLQKKGEPVTGWHQKIDIGTLVTHVRLDFALAERVTPKGPQAQKECARAEIARIFVDPMQQPGWGEENSKTKAGCG